MCSLEAVTSHVKKPRDDAVEAISGEAGSSGRRGQGERDPGERPDSGGAVSEPAARAAAARGSPACTAGSRHQRPGPALSGRPRAPRGAGTLCSDEKETVNRPDPGPRSHCSDRKVSKVSSCVSFFSNYFWAEGTHSGGWHSHTWILVTNAPVTLN